MSAKVLKGLLQAWTEDPKGRSLLVAWAVVGTGVTVRAVFVRRIGAVSSRKLDNFTPHEEAHFAAASREQQRPCAAGTPGLFSPLRRTAP